MLTSAYYTPLMPHYSAYTPSRSSPLSERSANIAPPVFDFSMGSPSERKSKTPQRTFKANPVMQKRDATTKRRRDMFFRRVQTGRDDKIWETRGEQIQQLDFVSDRKRWEAEKARQAPPAEQDIDEDLINEATLPEFTLVQNEPQPEAWMTEVDWVAAQEEHELEQLVSSMAKSDDAPSQHFGSDDEDYDSIFMECAPIPYEQQRHEPHSYSRFNNTNSTDIDMADG